MKSNQITIGEYTIHQDQQIGSGNQGQVYNCSNKSNEKLCAKIVNLEKDEQMREYQIIKQLLENPHYENLVLIKDIQLDHSTKKVTIIMEKCETSLRQELKVRKDLSDEEIQDFIYQFLQGYKILYNSKILHRDIKPDNILINKVDGKLIYKITDFGIGKICNQQNSLEVTQICTPSYGAPELMCDNGNYKYDQNPNEEFPQSLCDIYSLGLVIYELITGTLPFKNKTGDIKNFKLNHQGSPFKNETQSQYKELVEMMTQNDPNKRITFSQSQSNNIKGANPQFQLSTHFHSEPSQASFQKIQKIINQGINQNNLFQNQNQQFEPIDKQPQQFQVIQQNYKMNLQQDNIINRQGFDQNGQNNDFKNILNNQRLTSQAQNIQNNNFPPKQQRQDQLFNLSGKFLNQQEHKSNQFQQQQCRLTANINPNNQQFNINVYKTIQEYLDEIINNFEGLIDKAKLKELQDFKLKKSIQENDVKRLKNLFEYHNSKLGTYSLGQLKFFYCLVNYQKNEIPQIISKQDLQKTLNQSK